MLPWYASSATPASLRPACYPSHPSPLRPPRARRDSNAPRTLASFVPSAPRGARYGRRRSQPATCGARGRGHHGEGTRPERLHETSAYGRHGPVHLAADGRKAEHVCFRITEEVLDRSISLTCVVSAQVVERRTDD